MRLTLIACVALLMAGSVSWILSSKGPEVDLNPFPDKLDQRIEVHPGETVRVVEYGEDDQFKKVRGEAGISDGAEATLTYHPNNKVRTFVSYYPGEKHQIKQISIFQDDGLTYVGNWLWYENGVLKERTRYVDPTTFRIERFAEDGTPTLDAIQIVRNTSWVMRDEHRWDPNGTLRLVTHMDEKGAVETRTYFASGKDESWIRIDPARTKYLEDNYAEVDSAVVRTVEQTGAETVMKVYKPDGSYTSWKWVRDMSKSSIQVGVYDKHGILKVEQWWYLNSEGGYYLSSVRVFEGGSWTKLIMFSNDGSYITTVVDHHSKVEMGARTIHHYREDGTLEAIREVAEDGKETKKTEFTPEQRIMVDVDAELIRWIEMTPPKQVITPNPEPYHHGY